MVHNTALKRNSVLFWLVALSASAIFSIGLRFLVTPLVAAEDFGVPVSDAQSVAYLWAKGTRDIVFGLLGFVLLSLVSRRVLAVFTGIVALVPLGDFIYVYLSVGTSDAVALLIHGGAAVFMLVMAVCLWKGAGERAAETTVTPEPAQTSNPSSASGIAPVR